MASSSSSNSALIQQLDPKSRDLTAKIVAHLKSQGNFDELRRDCLEELDKMEAFRQLNQRVESYVATFLSKQEWSESLSKNQIRDNLRKHVNASDALKSGAQRLVSQVLEKKSKSFQTRLEGVVQNYIYMEKEKEKHSRYQNRSEPSRSFDYKSESVKTSTAGKPSESISDIDDIISQISGPNAPTSKSEGSVYTKNDSKESGHPSTALHQRSDSSLPKQQVTGSHSKSEPIYSKKGDNISVADAHKSTVSSKTSVGAKKINPSKRVIPKTTISQNSGIHFEKTVDSSSINAKTKTVCNKPSSSPKSQSPKIESPRDSADVEKSTTKVPENMSSLKSDIHRTSPLSNVSKGLHEKSKLGELGGGLHARQKMEYKYADSSKTISENTKPDEVESKVEEKPAIENHLKKEPLEKKTKDSSLLEKPMVQLGTPNDVASSGDDDDDDEVNKDTAIKDSLSKDSESDIESDVSDVSSVHTSDLSSFDGEVSSDSYHSDDDNTTKGTKRGTIHSRGESERKGDQSLERDKGNSRKGRKHLNKSNSKGTQMQIQMKKSNTSTADMTTKRKRGRPRKDRSETQTKQSRDSRQGRSRQEQAQQQVEKESNDGMPARDRSKRPIKKRRCYSPSSEGSREVCLPSKRTRVSSKDLKKLLVKSVSLMHSIVQ